MANKAAIECANELLQVLEGNNKPFGGKVFLGLGDFRQVAPVVKNSGPTATLEASIKSSSLWQNFQVLRLHAPIRNASDPEYSAWVDSIGDGTFNREQSVSDIEIELLDSIDSYQDIADYLFPTDILLDSYEVCRRSFLSPLNTYVDDFNNYMLDTLISSEGKIYYWKA